ncbi:MAG: glycosyltransferase [Aureliella sp.]
MRIALVITELYPGGAEKCLVNLACYLQSRGHQVVVWQLWPDPPPERRQLTQRLDQHGIAWHSGGARSTWQFIQASRWLRRELIAFEPDVTQAFLFHANVAASLAHRRFPRRMSGRLIGGARVAQPQRWRQRMHRWAAGRMEKLVCVSQSVAAHCHLIEKIPNGKLIVIPNGLEIPATTTDNTKSWSSLGLPKDARVLLFVGRLTEQKGILEFISRVVPDLLSRLPEHHLVLMGDGEQAEQLCAMARSLPCTARIHLVGWQSQAIEWMRAAELLVLPTRYEGMPNAILEAMSVGKPVVSFAVDGVRELLGKADTSDVQCVEPLNWPAFDNAIFALANNRDLQLRCGQANLARVEQHFQLTVQLARYEQLYERP